MVAKPITSDSFWETDLKAIESYTLNGRKVTDLPVRKEDGRVPSQGSVLLGRVRNIDQAVPMKNRAVAMLVRFFQTLSLHK